MIGTSDRRKRQPPEGSTDDISCQTLRAAERVELASTTLQTTVDLFDFFFFLIMPLCRTFKKCSSILIIEREDI